MRIRTDGDYAHREDAIERAASFYSANKTKAVVSACDDVPQLVANCRAILERDDLTTRQKREIAETLSTRHLEFDVDESIQVGNE